MASKGNGKQRRAERKYKRGQKKVKRGKATIEHGKKISAGKTKYNPAMGRSVQQQGMAQVVKGKKKMSSSGYGTTASKPGKKPKTL